MCVCVGRRGAALWSCLHPSVHHQLQVPSLSPSSSSWLWDQEEDRRRQEKWQEEQEHLLQVTHSTAARSLTLLVNLDLHLKFQALYECVCVFVFVFQEQYQRDQERLEAEWQRAQQDAAGELSRKSEVMLCGHWSLFRAIRVNNWMIREHYYGKFSCIKSP